MNAWDLYLSKLSKDELQLVMIRQIILEFEKRIEKLKSAYPTESTRKNLRTLRKSLRGARETETKMMIHENSVPPLNRLQPLRWKGTLRRLAELAKPAIDLIDATTEKEKWEQFANHFVTKDGKPISGKSLRENLRNRENEITMASRSTPPANRKP